jgi:hypothetical protein
MAYTVISHHMETLRGLAFKHLRVPRVFSGGPQGIQTPPSAPDGLWRWNHRIVT